MISSISRSRKGFINFRDSNLTKLLQRDLKSQCRLSFVCCATPSGLCSDQTKKTIEFGKIVSGVKTKPSRSLTVDDKSVIIQTLTRLEQLQKNDTPDIVREKAELELKAVEEHLFLGSQSKFDLDLTDSKHLVREECTEDSLSHILNEVSSTMTPENLIEADHVSLCNTTGVMSEAEQKFLEMSDQCKYIPCFLFMLGTFRSKNTKNLCRRVSLQKWFTNVSCFRVMFFIFSSRHDTK